jgi:hypothetical protein
MVIVLSAPAVPSGNAAANAAVIPMLITRAFLCYIRTSVIFDHFCTELVINCPGEDDQVSMKQSKNP